MPTLTLDQIENLCFDALSRVGASEPQSRAAALELRDAEAEGIRNVGLGYIHLYLKHLACGKVVGDAEPVIVRTSASSTVVDAAHGFCHTAYLLAEPRLIASARSEGIGMLAINRSYSAGVLGWFVRRLAQQGLVALMFANSSKAVAAHGGKVPFFGTNPMAFAAPRAGEDPVVLDMATASTARVNIVRAAREGEPIDPGHAIDENGEPTTDPAAALRGAQLPLAGPKGFGLGMMVDILGGVLTGGNCSYEAPLFSNNEDGPPNVGQSIIALDPAFYAEGFVDHLETMISAMTDGNTVRVPGDRRGELRQQHAEHGVEVPDTLLEQIAALSQA